MNSPGETVNGNWRPPGEPGPRCTRHVRLRRNAYSITGADGEVVLLYDSWRGERFGRLTPGELAMLARLAAGVSTERELLTALTEHDGTDGAAASTLLRRLHAGGWLTVHLGHDGRPLMSVRPLAPHRTPRSRPPATPRLSRFAVLRRDDGGLVLESPLSVAAVTVHDTGVLALLHELATDVRPTDLAGTTETADLPAEGVTAGPPEKPVPDLPATDLPVADLPVADLPATDLSATDLPVSIVDELVAELAWLGFVYEADEDSRPDLTTEQWGSHELWFHSRSRPGSHDLPSGATLWATDRFTPLPGRREPYPGRAVRLPRPDPDAMTDPSLNTVLDARRSVRSHDANHPMTLAQLGEFLHRSARVTRVVVAGHHEETLRPSPSGGALHSLEIYPVVTDVDGLPAGMYHYDPFDHQLEPVPASEFAVHQLAGQAGAAVSSTAPPQVLLVISARFGRVMWKYQSIGYSLILKDLGALMQTMYLVATAMGLAPCAIGAGDSWLFTHATGVDPLAEASVGEFALGSQRHPEPEPPA